MGLSKGKALFLSKVYERLFFKPLFYDRIEYQERFKA
jgi:hypothetical protein